MHTMRTQSSPVRSDLLNHIEGWQPSFFGWPGVAYALLHGMSALRHRYDRAEGEQRER